MSDNGKEPYGASSSDDEGPWSAETGNWQLRQPQDVEASESPAASEWELIPTAEVVRVPPHLRAPTPEMIRAARRRHVRTSVLLFIATLLSTFLVGSGYAPLEYLAARSSPDAMQQVERAILRDALRTGVPPLSVSDYFLGRCVEGLTYSLPLMLILLCHEMGHYLVAVANRVPASLPYFIPLPLPPLGTMGAVILQGRGVANRRQMFDIAVCGPLAGLIVTLPVLYYGILTSDYRVIMPMQQGMELGEPLILQWMIHWIHGDAGVNEVFTLNGLAMAGWVGVFVTALNLLPVGQLDGGHILYTLMGRRAHLVAWLVIIGGCATMWLTGTMSYILILILLLLTGVRHPPTANDRLPLGWGRCVVGWATLAFLIIGFTPEPIVVTQPRPAPPAPQQAPAAPGDFVKQFNLDSKEEPVACLPVHPATHREDSRRVAKELRHIAGLSPYHCAIRVTGDSDLS